MTETITQTEATETACEHAKRDGLFGNLKRCSAKDPCPRTFDFGLAPYCGKSLDGIELKLNFQGVGK